MGFLYRVYWWQKKFKKFDLSNEIGREATMGVVPIWFNEMLNTSTLQKLIIFIGKVSTLNFIYFVTSADLTDFS